MRKFGVAAIIVLVLLGIYVVGTSLYKNQWDVADRRCSQFTGDAGWTVVRWETFPRPGWTCETESGSRHIGLWPRILLATDPPRFEDARIVVRPGEERAYVGYTMIANGEGQYASYSDIEAVASDGRKLHWKHQRAISGSDDIAAPTGRSVTEPVGEPGGDAAFFDSSTVKVGETVYVTFRFPAGTVKVPFHVVGAR